MCFCFSYLWCTYYILLVQQTPYFILLTSTCKGKHHETTANQLDNLQPAHLKSMVIVINTLWIVLSISIHVRDDQVTFRWRSLVNQQL